MLVDDASAVAFLNLTGQALPEILNMSMAERRSNMESSLPEHFQVLYALPQPVELADILECAYIAKEMFRLFITKESRTYEIAKVNCRYFKHSKYNFYFLNESINNIQ